ncbi:hypothetical protein PUN28_012485 [Cardiocondyla obscurior]|uniref:Uncharacterized protein n=1 Tax=Cardiocondyla obscurior TaxID=286306 RepID=A0AAW2FF21_9HYME
MENRRDVYVRTGGRKGKRYSPHIYRIFFVRSVTPTNVIPTSSGRCESEKRTENRRTEKERRSEKATANSPVRDVLSGLVPRPFLPSSVDPAIYFSYFITRPRNRNTLRTFVRLSYPSLRLRVRFR